jgi:hypothetical protein
MADAAFVCEVSMANEKGVAPNPAGFVPGPPAVPLGWRSRDGTIDGEALVEPIAEGAARRVLVLAIAIGVLCQLLFVHQEGGLNVFLWTTGLLVAAALVRRRDVPMDRLDLWIPLAALLFAAFPVIRADPALLALDTAGSLGLVAASVAAFGGIPITRRSVSGVVILAMHAVAIGLTGPARLAPGLRGLGCDLPRSRASTLGRISIGILLALPIVLVFAALFAEADAVFGTMVGNLLQWPVDLGSLPVRLAVFAIAAWGGAGLLVVVAGATRHLRSDHLRISLPRIGAVEASVVLLAVDLLFGVFVLLQGAYLFGGSDTLQLTGMTFSQYARRGFFELVVVVVMVGGLIQVLESAVSDRPRAYRVAALILVGLTLAVLVSSAVRMALYQQAYGWTELRFYVVSAIAWLALCLLAAAVAIATGRSRWLPHAATILAITVALGVNVVGPQAFVASQNVARALDPGSIPADGSSGLDGAYLGALGDDAVPVLLSGLPSMNAPDRQIVTRYLVRRRAQLDALSSADGWPSWNLARERARTLLEAAHLP